MEFRPQVLPERIAGVFDDQRCQPRPAVRFDELDRRRSGQRMGQPSGPAQHDLFPKERRGLARRASVPHERRHRSPKSPNIKPISNQIRPYRKPFRGRAGGSGALQLQQIAL